MIVFSWFTSFYEDTLIDLGSQYANRTLFFEIIIFCFVVAIRDLVQDEEIIFHLSYVLKASEI